MPKEGRPVFPLISSEGEISGDHVAEAGVGAAQHDLPTPSDSD
jgi:hypothetical protein